jgi:hypothetical protein
MPGLLLEQAEGKVVIAPVYVVEVHGVVGVPAALADIDPLEGGVLAVLLGDLLHPVHQVLAGQRMRRIQNRVGNAGGCPLDVRHEKAVGGVLVRGVRGQQHIVIPAAHLEVGDELDTVLLTQEQH